MNKEEQKKLLIEIMGADEKNELYKTNNMAQETATEWFYQRILAKDIKEVFEQAKQMEKEQHKKTWDAAYKAAKDDIVSDKASTFENYYGKSNY